MGIFFIGYVVYVSKLNIVTSLHFGDNRCPSFLTPASIAKLLITDNLLINVVEICGLALH